MDMQQDHDIVLSALACAQLALHVYVKVNCQQSVSKQHNDADARR